MIHKNDSDSDTNQTINFKHQSFWRGENPLSYRCQRIMKQLLDKVVH